MKLFKTIIPVVVAFVFACLLSSCEYETIKPEPAVVIAPGTVVKFSQSILPIFSKYQCTACHPNTMGLDFNPANAYASLQKVVNTASPASSMFYIQMSSTHNGKTLTPQERANILEWIKEGALNN